MINSKYRWFTTIAIVLIVSLPYRIDSSFILPKLELFHSSQSSPHRTLIDSRPSSGSLRSAIFRHERLDPSNQNVYQDSVSTLNLRKNETTRDSDDRIDDFTIDTGDSSSNHYVPAAIKKQESRENQSKSSEKPTPDINVQSNNFQNDKRPHPRDHFVDVDDLIPKRSNNNNNNNDNNRHNRRPNNQNYHGNNRRGGGIDRTFDLDFKEFENEFMSDMFKMSDFNDFLNSRILI